MKVPVPIVILDTNPLFGDRALLGGQTGRLLALSRRGLLTLLIPEVVLLEVERQHRDEAMGKINQLNGMNEKAKSALRVLGLPDNAFHVSTQVPDIESVMNAYRRSLDSRLRDARVVRLPVPSVSHHELLLRDLGGRLPFISSGKGYRDALTWHAVLEYWPHTDPKQEAYFISNDNDFGRDHLDAALESELDDGGAKLTLLASIPDLLALPAVVAAEADLRHDLAHPPDPERDEFEDGEEEVVETAVRSAAEGLTDEPISFSSQLFARLFIPRAVMDLELSYAEPSGTVVWSPYEDLESTRLGQATVDVDAEFVGYVAKEDAAVLANHDIDVEEWQLDVAKVVIRRSARLTFDLRLEMSGQTVDDIRFASLDGP